MIRSLRDLETAEFDLAIVGGGITGACLAHDAALRGMSVALIEKGDFGAATSAASSKLLHGGIRYLQQASPLKLRESAIERVYFQKLAPHLTGYVPFVIPAYRGIQKGRLLLTAGLAAYEALCIGQNRFIHDPAKRVPHGRVLSKQEVLDRLPGVSKREITGGILIYESHMHNSERMTLGFLDTASCHGAVVANYVRADSFTASRGRVRGVTATDMITGRELEIRAAVVINAAGPWIPCLNSGLSRKAGRSIVTGYSKGAHIVTRPLTNDCAIALPTSRKNQAVVNRGGRHIFIIPWRGHSLIGTTYAPYSEGLDDVRPHAADVSELIDGINAALGDARVREEDVVCAYAGLYPLVDEWIDPQRYQGTGRYQVVDHGRTNELESLFSVFGAKFTTARLVAEQALNGVAARANKPFRECQTRKAPLTCGDIGDVEQYRRDKAQEYASIVSPEASHELVTNHGTRIDEVMAPTRDAPELALPLSPHHNLIQAEVLHSGRAEMVCRLDDFVFRRSGLGTLGDPGSETLHRCARLLGSELNWDTPRIEQEVRQTQEIFRRSCVPCARN